LIWPAGHVPSSTLTRWPSLNWPAAGSLDRGCAAIAGNSATGSGLGGGDVELDQNYATTYDLPGYTGAPEDTSAVESFLIGNNDGSGTPTAVATVSGSGGGFAGVTGC